MKLSVFVLMGAAFSFAAACHALPEPPPETPAAEETAIAPAAPMVMPMVGGPCAYETTMMIAPVAAVYDSVVTFTGPDGRDITVPRSKFAEPPEAGMSFELSKRKITKGTCQPIIYSLIEPAVPVVIVEMPAPEN